MLGVSMQSTVVIAIRVLNIFVKCFRKALHVVMISSTNLSCGVIFPILTNSGRVCYYTHCNVSFQTLPPKLTDAHTLILKPGSLSHFIH